MNDEPKTSSGIFITKGMSLTVRDFKLTFDNGELTASNLALDLRYDACSAWMNVAWRQVLVARKAKAARLVAWEGSDEESKGWAIEEEFLASLQAIVAISSAIDAFYASTKELIVLPDQTTTAWSKGRTARHKQVAETFRIAFSLNEATFAKVIEMLDSIYRVRGAALHPSGKPHPPQYHPELSVHTEWRLVTFRCDNADTIVCSGIGLIWDLVNHNSKPNIQESNTLKGLRSSILNLFPGGKPEPACPQANFWLPL